MGWIFILAMLPALAFYALSTLYLWRLLAAALMCEVSRRKRLALSPADGEQKAAPSALVRFIVLIPAHDEEMVLGAALKSLHELDYPPGAYRVVVTADNCTDATAEIAREEGALVLTRTDTERRGKGYALAFAQRWLLGEAREEMPPLWDALVILDADTLAAPNLLKAFAERLNAGQEALQARYGVLNAEESWRTRLMCAALALNHFVKPLGREKLGLSVGLKGNGMAFSRSVVERYPWPESDLTEDIAYTLQLGWAGVRVSFVPETTVLAQMPTTGTQAAGQRRRWEAGRSRLRRTLALALLLQGVRTHSRILRDMAIDLIIPPFAELFMVPAVLSAACLFIALHWHSGSAAALAFAWAVVLALQWGYLSLGLWIARVPRTVALAVLLAPAYIVWKLGLRVLGLLTGPTRRWQRTDRRRM